MNHKSSEGFYITILLWETAIKPLKVGCDVSAVLRTRIECQPFGVLAPVCVSLSVRLLLRWDDSLLTYSTIFYTVLKIQIKNWLIWKGYGRNGNGLKWKAIKGLAVSALKNQVFIPQRSAPKQSSAVHSVWLRLSSSNHDIESSLFIYI